MTRWIALLLAWPLGLPAMATEGPSLLVQRLDEGAGEVSLCFPADMATVHYELVVAHHDLSGNTGQTRQRGQVDSDQERCPVKARYRLQPGSTLEARLRWWRGDDAPVEVVRILEG
jgi:hypothetical protein